MKIEVIPFLVPLAAQGAVSSVYLTEAEAVKVLAPGKKLERSVVNFTEAELKRLRDVSSDRPRSALIQWKSADGDTVLVDQVLGKHEMITYAVAINGQGAVTGVEILEYRESFGFEVRRPQWRQQFVGKTKTDKLELDGDIKNIAGATLSSAHITAGVKRLLETYELLKSRS